MQEREVTITTADGQMPAFIVHPGQGEAHPVALLFMDGIGYREQIRVNARRFAGAGYFVVAPDLFYQSGTGITLDMTKMMSSDPDNPERKRMMEVVASVTPERVERDTAAILESTAADPAADASRLVCVGYCMGARMSLHMAATHPNVVAAAGIHPGALVTDKPDSPHRELGRVRAELYIAFAEQGRAATPESIDAFRAAMDDASVPGTVERLSGTGHGFAMADLPVYDHDAADRHFERTIDLWDRALAVGVR